jgi:hypothetical protein
MERAPVRRFQTGCMLVFIDESGSSGFKLTRGADAVFAIGMVIFESASDAARTEEVIARLRRVVSHKPEFKFSKSSDRLRDAFFRAICDCPFRIRALALDRRRMGELPEGLHGETFHRFFLCELLRRAACRLDDARIALDGDGNRVFQRNLKAELRRQVQGGIAELRMVDSRRDEPLQLADMCVGAVARAFRQPSGADRWLRLLEARLEELSTFP